MSRSQHDCFACMVEQDGYFLLLTFSQAAQQIGRSKSSAHRQQKGIDRRNQYPESTFWETEVGYGWLRLLVFAVQQSAATEPLQANVALDETFFGNFLILVMIELNSGFLLLEEISENRRFETWKEKITPRLEQLGVTVPHAVSAQARALIKMAVTVVECQSGAQPLRGIVPVGTGIL